MIHDRPSELAGKRVRIRDGITHPQVSDFGGQELAIEDWWDRVVGKSWMVCDGNPACLVYAARTGFSDTPPPTDDEVLYGKLGGFGHLVHMSEIEAEGGEGPGGKT